MGLAQADTTTDEQGVEFTAGGFCHRQGSRMGHTAVRTDHEAAEHITGVQPRQHPAR